MFDRLEWVIRLTRHLSHSFGHLSNSSWYRLRSFVDMRNEYDERRCLAYLCEYNHRINNIPALWFRKRGYQKCQVPQRKDGWGSNFCEMTREKRKYSLFLRQSQFLILSFYRANNQWREKKPLKKERERRDTFPHKVSQTHSFPLAAYRHVGQFECSLTISNLPISDASHCFYRRNCTCWRQDYDNCECLAGSDVHNLDACSALSCPLDSICTDVIYHCSTAPCPPKLECVPRGIIQEIYSLSQILLPSEHSCLTTRCGAGEQCVVKVSNSSNIELRGIFFLTQETVLSHNHNCRESSALEWST